MIKNLVDDYKKHQCVITYRGFTPKMENLEKFDYETRCETINKHIHNFPTGKGGILYKPQFFHSTGDLIFDKDIYIEFCDKQDDIWFYILRIKNDIKCFVGNKKWEIKDNSNADNRLFYSNSVNNTNTRVFRRILKKLSTL